ncbi:MAG: insulinase family protein [Caulobacteraceae bacterium]
MGGLNNASTWDDFTNYFDVVPSNHLERLLWGRGRADELADGRRRQLQVRAGGGRGGAAPAGAGRSLRPLPGPGDPGELLRRPSYKRPGIGSIADLDAAGIADVVAFHATYYRPDNAMLIVAGDFDPVKLDAWVDQYFGGIKSPAAPFPKVTAKEPPRTGPKTVTTYGPTCPCRPWPSPGWAPRPPTRTRRRSRAGRHPHRRRLRAAEPVAGLPPAAGPERVLVFGRAPAAGAVTSAPSWPTARPCSRASRPSSPRSPSCATRLSAPPSSTRPRPS